MDLSKMNPTDLLSHVRNNLVQLGEIPSHQRGIISAILEEELKAIIQPILEADAISMGVEDGEKETSSESEVSIPTNSGDEETKSIENDDAEFGSSNDASDVISESKPQTNQEGEI